MKPGHSEPTDAEVRAFGHLAQDIAYLRRGCGLIVAPFKDGFRIDGDVVGAAELRARADRERKRRNHKAAATVLSAPARPLPNVAATYGSGLDDDKRARLKASLEAGDTIGEAARAAGVSKSTAHKHKGAMPVALVCPCGRPNSHQGRCWSRRGLSGPDSQAPIVPSTPERLDALERAIAEIRQHLGMDGGR